MKKRIYGLVAIAVLVVCLSGCGNKALEDAKTAVENYNTQLAAYNAAVSDYNTAVQKIADANQELEDAVNAAQEVINKGEEPFDEETLSALKDAMSEALATKINIPDACDSYSEITLDESAKKNELEEITAKANSDAEAMSNCVVPDTIPEIPDYTEKIQNVTDAQVAYEDSIQGLKQITAPSDEFVMERLRMVDTITAMEPVTEDNDPNGKLNKQGGYIGCVYFTDSQVDRSQLYIESGKDGVIDVGCDGGGALEIYKTAEEAQARDTYLSGFDGTAFASGSHYIYGTILVRTSDSLSGTKQLELTQKIVDALTYVEH